MARHVHECHLDVADAGMREAQVDGDSASLFFFETIHPDPIDANRIAVGPIRVDTRQRTDERALAVIDVAGGANYQRRHRLTETAGPGDARPASSRESCPGRG